MAPPIKASHSQAELSKIVGVSVKSLRQWRNDEGLNLSDLQAVKDRAARVGNSMPESSGESYAEAKRRRAVADATVAELRAGQQAGKLIDLAEVEQAFAEIGFVLRARLLALPSNLVSELEGLTASQIHSTLKKNVHQLLHDLHENSPIDRLTAASPTKQDPATTSHSSRD